MTSFFDDVLEWHRTVLLEHDYDTHKEWTLSDREWSERIRLILEELSELSLAQALGDEREFVDALADLAFVVLGTAVRANVPFNAIWDEVRRSNNSKLGGKKDEGGKLIKPSSYSEPNIERIRRYFNAESR